MGKGFTALQAVEKHGWLESLVWALKPDGKCDLPKYHELKLGLRTGNNWYRPDFLTT